MLQRFVTAKPWRALWVLAAASCAQVDGTTRNAPKVSGTSPEEVGRYVTTIAACNDCHSVGWEDSPNGLPDSLRLLGSPLAWVGPWGVTYAPNLRLTVQGMTEDQWVTMLRTRNDRPPMPWINVRSMHESDLRAIYRYLKMLGPAGETMPAALPPGSGPVSPPYIDFVLGAPPTE